MTAASNILLDDLSNQLSNLYSQINEHRPVRGSLHEVAIQIIHEVNSVVELSQRFEILDHLVSLIKKGALDANSLEQSAVTHLAASIVDHLKILAGIAPIPFDGEMSPANGSSQATGSSGRDEKKRS